MSDNGWFYYKNEQVYGPVTLNTITEMIDSGELNEACAICEGRDGDWKYLRELAASVPDSAQDSAHAAITKMNTIRPGGRTTQTVARNNSGRGSRFSVADLLAPAVDFAFHLLRPFGRISRQRWTTIGACVVVMSVIVVLSRLYYHSTRQQRAIIAVQAVWTEYQELRKSKPSELVWATFSEQARADLASASEILAESSSSQQGMDTLRVGRDALPKLLGSWPETDETAMKQCLFLFARISRTSQALSSEESPWWVSAIIGFDVLLVGVAIWWCLIRKDAGDVRSSAKALR